MIVEAIAKRKVGRPCLLNEKISAKIIELSEKGKTIEQIAEITGVSKRALHYWWRDNPEFMHAVKEARQVADELVEASLFSKALGYTYEEEALGKFGPVPLVKQAHPDVVACIYWLKNRQPDKWRDKSEHEHSIAKDEEDFYGPWNLNDVTKKV